MQKVVSMGFSHHSSETACANSLGTGEILDCLPTKSVLQPETVLFAFIQTQLVKF